MIKECLKVITDPKYKDIHNNIKMIINNYEDYQIEYALVNGIAISENLILQKYPNSSFNCFNKDRMMVGLLPICKLIEAKLNSELKTKLLYS